MATMLWSLNGVFMPLLRSPTRLNLNVPTIEPMHVAFYRVFFAGLVLVPTLRRADISWRWGMLFAAGCFAAMNLTFTLALAQGDVASTLFLQYTAPAWLYLASVYVLGDAPNRRGFRAVLIALLGVIVIVGGGWSNDQIGVMLLALASGVTYAGVLLGIGRLRGVSPRWLTVVNLLSSALVLLPFAVMLSQPSLPQLAALMIFGGLQLGLPYWLMARGLRSVGPQEAGILTLAEPLLSTLWAYLVGGQVPSRWTALGGVLILAALAYQYWPRRK